MVKKTSVPPKAWVGGITEMCKQYAPDITNGDVIAFIGRVNNPEEEELPSILPRDIPCLLTVPETAKLIRCHRVTVNRLIWDGKLTPIRFSDTEKGKTLLKRSDVDRFLRDRLGA